MPETPSNDAGNVNGMVHSHRFIAANTALPFVNKDAVQLKDTEDFLKDKKVRVDIFAISPETAENRISNNKVSMPRRKWRRHSLWVKNQKCIRQRALREVPRSRRSQRL